MINYIKSIPYRLGCLIALPIGIFLLMLGSILVLFLGILTCIFGKVEIDYRGERKFKAMKRFGGGQW